MGNGHVVTVNTPITSNEGSTSKEGKVCSKMLESLSDDSTNDCRDPFDFAALAVLHIVKDKFEESIVLREPESVCSDLHIEAINEQLMSLELLYDDLDLDFRSSYVDWDYKRQDWIRVISKERRLPVDIPGLHRIKEALSDLDDAKNDMNYIRKLFTEQTGCITSMRAWFSELNEE